MPSLAKENNGGVEIKNKGGNAKYSYTEENTKNRLIRIYYNKSYWLNVLIGVSLWFAWAYLYAY